MGKKWLKEYQKSLDTKLTLNPSVTFGGYLIRMEPVTDAWLWRGWKTLIMAQFTHMVRLKEGRR